MTRLADIIIPELFVPAIQQLTEEKSRIVQSGALQPNELLTQELAGGGMTFNAPSYRDLENNEERTSNDDPSDVLDNATDHEKTSMDTEIQVRLSRNNSWTSMDLAAALAGSDPLDSIISRIANYWTRRLQAAFVATVKGIFLDSTANHSGDLSNIISEDATTPGDYEAGVTDFSAEAFLDAVVTIGDSMDQLGLVMMHSIVYNRAQKNNLIDFIPDSEGKVNIPMFLGRTVVVDDGMPATGGVFDTWIFGSGAFQLGSGSPKVPVETDRIKGAGNGAGQEVLYHRLEWIIYPVGYAFQGATPGGGPTNTTLALAASWTRVFPERKQIKLARLVSREF